MNRPPPSSSPSAPALNAGAGAAAALAGLLLCAAASPSRAEPAAYTLDPAHTFAHFELLHFSTSTVRGRLGPVTGVVELDRAAQRGTVSLRIPVAGVSTGVPVFDARLRAPDLLATAAFPEAFFVASRLRFEGERLAEVRGEFTLRGNSQPLSLRALRFACRSDPPGAPDATGAAAGSEVCGGDFEAEFDRSDFGISFGLPFIANRVRLVVQAEGRRQ